MFKKSGVPMFYIKCLADLEDFTSSKDDKENKKKMDAPNAKALTALSQKLRKHNKQYASQISDFKENPQANDVESAKAEIVAESKKDKEENGSFWKKKQPETKKAHGFFKKQEESEDEESSDFTEDEETETETESEDDQNLVGAAKWKKKAPVAQSQQAAAKKPQPKKETKQVSFQQKSILSETEESEVEGPSRPRAQQTQAALTSENVYQKLREVMEARGKRGTDKLEQIGLLEKILLVARTPIQRTKVLMALISARFDFNFGTTSSQSVDMWKSTEKEISQIFDILEQHADIKIDEAGDEFDEELHPDASANEVKTVRGNIVSLLVRLDDEYMKSLQAAESGSQEYEDRLTDECLLYSLIIRAERYCVQQKDNDNLTRLRMLRLEHVYYKYNEDIRKLETDSMRLLNITESPAGADELVHDLCVFLYHNAGDRIRTRAVLCHVYHHALNKRFSDARDLILMSHLQDSISKTDISTQILYNRAIAQIGICAFRCGLVMESHNALNDLMASLKTKDLLAQGTQMQRYQGTELEKKEKQRMLPFHMHINLELLEAIQLTVAMFLEVPSMAMNKHDNKKKMVSKHYRRLLEQHEKQEFQCPPENFKDYIMQASTELMAGNWQEASELITSVSVWNLLPDFEAIKSNLVLITKKEALRTHLWQYGAQLESVPVSYLSQVFDLSADKVESVLAKMILAENFKARIDPETRMVHLRQEDATKLQFLIAQLCDKATSVIENNEKLSEIKHSMRNPADGVESKRREQNK